MTNLEQQRKDGRPYNTGKTYSKCTQKEHTSKQCKSLKTWVLSQQFLDVKNQAANNKNEMFHLRVPRPGKLLLFLMKGQECRTHKQLCVTGRDSKLPVSRSKSSTRLRSKRITDGNFTYCRSGFSPRTTLFHLTIQAVIP